MSADSVGGVAKNVVTTGAALGGAAAEIASVVAQAEAREKSAHEKVAKNRQ